MSIAFREIFTARPVYGEGLADSIIAPDAACSVKNYSTHDLVCFSIKEFPMKLELRSNKDF